MKLRDRVTELLLALLLGAGTLLTPICALASSPKTGNPEALPPTASREAEAAVSPDIPFHEYEDQIERQLLDLANQSRAAAGAPPLILDAGLSQAARIHAKAMLEARQLSHRFEGEASLPQRLATTTHLQLDAEGENVAFDYSAEGGHQNLMLSPPHRANLLDPAFNVVGLGVVRSGDRLYMVQDFGHAVPNYSAAEVKDRIAAAVNQMRQHGGRPELQRLDLPAVDGAACSMAHADKLGTAPVYELAARYTVMTFTTLHSETLPASAAHAITSPNLHSVSIGDCYGRTASYPTGVYWVVLSLD